MEKFGKFCAFILLFIATVAVKGVVFSAMWNWFVVPLGAPTIGLWLAIGVAMTASIAVGVKTGSVKSDEEKSTVEQIKDMAIGCCGYFAVLGMGAIVQVFV